MLLEEALAGNSNNNSSRQQQQQQQPYSQSSLLSPSDAALALLSFLRDELPAGGIAAEKRFVNLFPLIIDRSFGSLVLSDGSSSGGLTPTSAVITATTTTTATTTASSSAYSSAPSSLEQGSHRHTDGGWLSLREAPHSSSSSSASPARPRGVSSGAHSDNRRPPPSLGHDAIVRLLRAPHRPPPPTNNNNNNNNNQQQQPTLLDAMSAESTHRPNVRFKFPLCGLPLPLIEDWKVCLLNNNNELGITGMGSMGGGGGGHGGMVGNSNIINNSHRTFGGSSSTTQNNEPNNANNAVAVGMIGKENATRIVCKLLSAAPMEQLELRSYFQHRQMQMQMQSYMHHPHGSGSSNNSPYSKSTAAFGASSPLTSPTLRGSPLSSKRQHWNAAPSSPITTASATATSTAAGGRTFANTGTANGTTTTLYGRTNNGITTAATTTTNATLHDPHVELNMMEYYLFIFLRFPLAHPSLFVAGGGSSTSSSSTTTAAAAVGQMPPTQSSSSGVSNRSHGPPYYGQYGQRVYSYLFSTYLSYYLPHGIGIIRTDNNSSQEVGITCFDSAAMSCLDRNSELFLRLVIEFWIEGYNTPPTMAEASLRYRRVRGGMGHVSGGSRGSSLSNDNGNNNISSSSNSNSHHHIAAPSLKDSMELAQPAKCPFKSPPLQVQNLILNLVRHLVSDRSMRDMVQSASAACQRQQSNERTGPAANGDGNAVDAGVSGNASPGGNGDNSTIPRVPWCLTPAMTATQTSLFNYIRLGLACGLTQEPNSIFYRALEAWLIWLEPWNYIMKKRLVTGGGRGLQSSPTNRAGEFFRNAAATVATSSSQLFEYYPSYVAPKPTSASCYSSQWEAYVVSNIHLYTVPLAIFLKRARELDFSSTAEYPRSLALVQRVLRIYSKPVVTVINSVLNNRADAVTATFVSRHEENLGEFRPPNNLKLASCQSDSTNLLEEIFTQHHQRMNEMDFLDRWGSKIEALFSGKYVVNEEAALQTLVSQVRCLVNLPLDYQVLPDEPRKTHWFHFLRIFGNKDVDAMLNADGDDRLISPEREANGNLTDRGRQQLSMGMRKCNPMDVHFIGDPMMARVKSYEVPALVELTVSASNYLNKKLGLVPEEHVVMDTHENDDDVQLKLYREMEKYNSIAFRVNLRFLADSRNIVFFSILIWFVRAIGIL